MLGYHRQELLRFSCQVLSCYRFRGHEDKIVTKELESEYDGMKVNL